MKIAVVGATGLVGREILKILAEKGFDSVCELVLYASNRSEGKILQVGAQFVRVRTLEQETLEKVDFAIFSAGGNISKIWAKKFARLGAVVIDNSSAFRRKENVPLVVPEINFGDISSTHIIANPNCSTIALALPLYLLAQHAKIKRVVISTYQAVSGAGQRALDDLASNTTNKFSHPITDNIIPQIDRFLPSGNTFEEDKMIFELKKILHNQNLAVSATCVRVPVSNCHSESVNIEFEKNVSAASVKKWLTEKEGVCVVDNPKLNLYPMPILAGRTDDILVGRIRKDKSSKNCINMFLCMNNLRKGAALNAVQILERLIKRQ